jgi:hypothetical protein
MVEAVFKLSFQGSVSDEHLVDAYDVGRAILGLQRSVAITTNFILTGDIVTQAPAIKGFSLVALPPRNGSWEWVMVLMGGGTITSAAMYQILTAPKDTPLGHLVTSAYAAVLKRATGIDLDYDTTIGASMEQARNQGLIPKNVTPERLESVVEKTENSLIDLHRPIQASGTANQAFLYSGFDKASLVQLDLDTFDFISSGIFDSERSELEGEVSSYNMNTFSGRIYVSSLQRTIPFKLQEPGKTDAQISRIARSLYNNVEKLDRDDKKVLVEGYFVRTKNGRVKRFNIISIKKYIRRTN